MTPQLSELLPRIRRQNDAEALTRSIVEHLAYHQCRAPGEATSREVYRALAHAVRERLVDRWIATEQHYADRNVRRVGYLSLEYLTGRLLRSGVEALGLRGETEVALRKLGHHLEEVEEQETASALGSGGLGRLAACFLDSLAALELPAWGYGLRYRYGLFRQRIERGWQVEEPYDWLRWGKNPWEVARPEEAVRVSFYGHAAAHADGGTTHFRWVDTQDVLAVPFDVPVAGFRNGTVNTLRLWEARPLDSGVRLDVFHSGEFAAAHDDERRATVITEVLYPAERTEAGRELRLKQQYLLSSATLQDCIRRHLLSNPSLDNLPETLVLQLNDTHPAIAIPELMRLLLDENGYGWERAWEITSGVFNYTNHTLQPEALETWPFQLVARLLPRHSQIVQEIDRRLQDQVRQRFPGDEGRVQRMALIGPGPERRIHMAPLSVLASKKVNGVAALHTELLKSGVLKDWYDLFPERFNNKTNGITPRRWLYQANSALAALVTSRIGDGWLKDLSELKGLEAHVDDAEFRAAFRQIKADNKAVLARVIKERIGLEVDPGALVDAQIKRIHEYKRQLLMTLYIVDQYLQLQADPEAVKVPRTFVFAGKAAADYTAAKLIVRLIHAVAERVNHDPELHGKLKVAFLPNYGVSLAQRIVVGADLSEQISTAGHEASGTGNMKFALNGALTIGTLDGANVEIREEVGDENIFIFGLKVEEVAEIRRNGYRPRDHYEQNPRLRAVIDTISGSTFCPEDPGLFHPVVDSLLERDDYLLLADFQSYVEAQEAVSRLYHDDPEAWTTQTILNVARSGKFSSDRTIREYNRDVWHLEPQQVD